MRRLNTKQYSLESLSSSDPVADHALKELKTLLNFRVNEGLLGNISSKSISQILDEELIEANP